MHNAQHSSLEKITRNQILNKKGTAASNILRQQFQDYPLAQSRLFSIVYIIHAFVFWPTAIVCMDVLLGNFIKRYIKNACATYYRI